MHREAIDGVHDAAWRRRVMETFGSVPVIRYFQTPLVVDNALQETIREVAPG